ncbi:MAG: hypothetical protein H7144_07575, partial [Burkholderiales bacterium]|nr:hypothetical protein [Phycisphaerae bacterium]
MGISDVINAGMIAAAYPMPGLSIDPAHGPQILAGATLGVLVIASVIGAVMSKTATSEPAKKTIANLNA